ncbi:hypothetical protein GCM10027187_40510 [Streptosporangium sandarakinum]|uniref:Uncharacterized protein n=1 Tax=Streptosporangium sandarakinum TaxID=1260955 RepID=A0A852V947_9ACTN|nr:hypothetical protein [Streptosporangium sandarakinum]NYF44620.1 hypothetical protein [Streptosporangium sandarakinum]
MTAPHRPDTAQGCAALFEQLIRFATAAALLWSALTTSRPDLAALCWTLFGLFILGLILHHAATSARPPRRPH